MKIYVTSSWRNEHQQEVVRALRSLGGTEVYDFRNPPGKSGFQWTELDPNWEQWTVEQYRDMLRLPRAEEGFKEDMDALMNCDACLLVLPCGRSAHLELGFAAGVSKRCAIYYPPGVNVEPELMNKMVGHILSGSEDLAEWGQNMKAIHARHSQ